MSLKEAKIRATPKTSSPVKIAMRRQFHDAFSLLLQRPQLPSEGQVGVVWFLTLTDVGAQGDVLLGGADGLLGRHLEIDSTGSLTVKAYGVDERSNQEKISRGCI